MTVFSFFSLLLVHFLTIWLWWEPCKDEVVEEEKKPDGNENGWAKWMNLSNFTSDAHLLTVFFAPILTRHLPMFIKTSANDIQHTIFFLVPGHVFQSVWWRFYYSFQAIQHIWPYESHLTGSYEDMFCLLTPYIYTSPHPETYPLLYQITSNPRFYIHFEGMVHRVGSQAFIEPVFCALSSCGFFCVCSFNLSFCFLKVQKFISAEKWVPTGIVAKKWDPGILDPGPFSGQIRKIEARLGKLAKIRKVETD